MRFARPAATRCSSTRPVDQGIDTSTAVGRDNLGAKWIDGPGVYQFNDDGANYWVTVS
jgi:hypothetical protein